MVRDDPTMDSSTDYSILGVIRILVLVQGAVAVVAALQVLAVGTLLGGPLGFLILLGIGAAALTLSLAAGITRRSRRARRILLVLEVLWLFAAAVDLSLSLFLAQQGLGLVAFLTRIVLPYSIFRLLRRPRVRSEFGLGPTRRQRRKAARSQQKKAAGAPAARELEMA